MGDMTAIGAPSLPSQVIVAVRLRPLLATDRPHEMICAQALPYTQQVVLGHNCYSFQMDSSFPMDANQSQVFETAVAPLIERLLQGYDISVATYGQSKSGKTHTIFGPGVNHCHVSETEYGIVPRAARYIFTRLKQGPPKKTKITISFLEVQNEKVRDLLASSPHHQELTVVESDAGYPVVTGLQEVMCESIFDLFSWLQMGMENRLLDWNNSRLVGHPSHSHCVFTFYLEQQWVTPDGIVEQRLSVARFSDLASSEKIFYKGINGEIIGEPVHLDTGLIALSNVVGSMSQLSPWPSSGLPNELCMYRQSTLTKILKESFGGRCFSLVICCISPVSLNFDESLMTLKFAERLRSIRNYPVLNALSVKVCTDRPVPETSKQNIHGETMSVEGAQADLFGLEFAASQWMKLVDSAEGLFNRLVKTNMLTEKEKAEIEKWLCLKHECEECVASDGSESAAGNECRILEKIDEVTEMEEKTDSSKEALCGKVHKGDDKQYDSESESEADSQRPEFTDRLYYFLEQFKEKTDVIVLNQRDLFRIKGATENSQKIPESSDNEQVCSHPVRSCLPSRARRRSIHPGTQLPLFAFSHSQQVNPSDASERTKEINDEKEEQIRMPHDTSLYDMIKQRDEDECVGILEDTLLKPHQELKLLAAKNEEKKNQIEQIANGIDDGYKQKQELQETIQIKEQFIQYMHNNEVTRNNARQHFKRKRAKLEEEYCKIQNQIEALYQTPNPSEESGKFKKEVEKLKKKSSKYERRLKNIKVVDQIAGDSSKKVLELELSLHQSKRQMDKLKQRLKREELRKTVMEQELQRDQKKLEELKEENNIQASDQDKNESAECSLEENLSYIKKEEEHFHTSQTSSQHQELLQQSKSINSDKREALKEKHCLEKQRTGNVIEKHVKSSHSDYVSKGKSIDLQKIKDEDEREAQRLEIHNLRLTKEVLVDNRRKLDNIFQEGNSLSNPEERQFLESDEGIEAIDTVIEFKNELICGRKGGLDASGRGKREEMLMSCLNKLPPIEMRMLLYKYFYKVIDLRECSRKLEAQLSEKEHQLESMTYTKKELEKSLQQTRQIERYIVFLQNRYHEKIHYMLRMFAEESSEDEGAGSGGEITDYHRHPEEKYKSTQRMEARRLRQKPMESHTLRIQSGRKNGVVAQNAARSRSVSPEPIPNKNLKQLQAAASSLTTKVTRQKNKIIIQQQKQTVKQLAFKQ